MGFLALRDKSTEGRPSGVKQLDKELSALRTSTPGIGDLQRNQMVGQNITQGQKAVMGDVQGGLGNRFLQRGNVDPALNAATAAAIIKQQQEDELQKQRIQAYNTQIGANDASSKKKAAIVGGIAQGAAMFSDETLKKDILDITDFTKQTLGALTPYQFQYSVNVGMPGNVIGVMAQDLEKSATGRTLIQEHEGKKAIDVPRAVSFILASLADINKRLEKAGV